MESGNRVSIPRAFCYIQLSSKAYKAVGNKFCLNLIKQIVTFHEQLHRFSCANSGCVLTFFSVWKIHCEVETKQNHKNDLKHFTNCIFQQCFSAFSLLSQFAKFLESTNDLTNKANFLYRLANNYLLANKSRPNFLKHLACSHRHPIMFVNKEIKTQKSTHC